MVVQLSRADLGPIAQRILADYENYESLDSPFERDQLPEKKVIDEIEDREDRAKILTLTMSVNYMKETSGESGIWQTSYRFWKNERWLFEPELVVQESTISAIADLFGAVGWMGNQDAKTWYTLCETFARDFDGNPMYLLEHVGYDALELRGYMERNGQDFPFLKGQKIGPLWLRLIHEEVHPLERIEEIPVPVDTHIISITNELLGRNYSHSKNEDNDEVRQIWSSVCKEHGLVPVRLDQPLWLTAKYWDEWGQEYVNTIIDTVLTD